MEIRPDYKQRYVRFAKDIMTRAIRKADVHICTKAQEIFFLDLTSPLAFVSKSLGQNVDLKD